MAALLRQLRSAVRENNLPFAQTLMKQHKLDVNYRFEEWDNETVLHVAAAKGYLDVVKSLVEEFQADVNIENNLGEVPLHAACNFECTDVMRYLIEKGSDYADDVSHLILPEQKTD